MARRNAKSLRNTGVRGAAPAKTNSNIVGQKKQAGPVNQRSSTANHKYIRKEWVNGKWKYYYRDDVQGAGKGLDILSGNATKRATSNASYTSKDGSRLNVRNTNKTVGGKRTRTVNVNGKPTQVTTIEVGKADRAVKKATTKAKSTVKSAAKSTSSTIKSKVTSLVDSAKKANKKRKTKKAIKKAVDVVTAPAKLRDEAVSAIAKNTSKKIKKTDAYKSAKKSIKKTKKTIKKTVKKAKKNTKKKVNKLIKNVGGRDLQKALKKFKKTFS